MTKNNEEEQVKENKNLVTERDIDPDFGLFTEDSFPDALEDEDQRDAVKHAIPDEQTSDKPSSGHK
ncbi:hypothetical protein M3629_15630 [Paenibacillus polysaccharolyticus]|uniref:hypothetical protein n=1 Tax=Paenibacillus polysaccharolyticus TaxID=582692 RepID=UPI00203A573E|nr:hypothetical protein [Paenibacillus polysaccharolyticus]MCM3134223.1 hypothetical protein [Paenibacillus polysaccharolyticus]